MANTKRVLLARPHAFIVAEMRPFLEKSGYTPVKLESFRDLVSGNLGSFSGAVISTGVISSVEASAEEVFAALRKKYPTMPVMFAGLMEIPIMQTAIDRAVRSIHANAEILPMTASTETHAGLGREHVFLALRREDLAPGAALEASERIIRKHFK